MKLRDYVLEQIKHRETEPVPFTLTMVDEISTKVDAYYAPESWQDLIPPYIETILLIDTDRREAIDDVYLVDAYGGKWRHDRYPSYYLIEPAIKKSSLDDFVFPKASLFCSETAKERALQRSKESQSFRVIKIKYGLFEQSWRRRGYENVLIDAVLHPDFYRDLIQEIQELYLDIINFCRDIPAEAIMFEDDWGYQEGVILGPALWRQFIKPYQEEIYAEVHSQGKYVISHCCGSIVDIMDDIIEIGLDVLESVQPEARGMNPYKLKERFGDKITFWGGLGSQGLIPFGKPEEIQREIQRLVREMGRGGGYILSPSKRLQPDTPVENARAILETFLSQTK